MLLEHALDFAGGDVLAAADDEVLGAAGDVEIAVVVHPADVARVEPAAAHRLACLLAAAEVAGHNARALGDDLALLTRREDFALGVHDHHHHVFHRPPHGPETLELSLALLRRALRDLVVLRSQEGEG